LPNPSALTQAQAMPSDVPTNTAAMVKASVQPTPKSKMGHSAKTAQKSSCIFMTCFE
jgi:hypothetical protein